MTTKTFTGILLDEHTQLSLTEFRGNRCYMRRVNGRCINLRIEGDRFTCAIYERRPTVCRDYERGGDACAVDRERRYGS